MSSLEVWLSESVVQALGWTLIHFLWQGVLVAVLFASTKVLLRGAGPGVRYAMACGALALMVVLPVTSFSLMVSPPQPTGEESVVSLEQTQPSKSPPTQQVVPATPKPTTPPQSWSRSPGILLDYSMPWIVLFWTMGVVTLSIRLTGGWLYARRLRWEGTEPASPKWRLTFRNLVKRVEVSRPVRLLLSTRVEVPMVIGWLRPVVLVPLSALAGLSPQQLEGILVHELAHIRRYDYLINLLQRIVETLLFYHPMVWWISRQIRAERENCCDDWAVTVCGDARVYARALTRLEEQRVSTALAVSASGGSLLSRIRRLVGMPSRRRQSPGLVVAGIVVLAAGAIAISVHAFVLSSSPSSETLIAQEKVPNLNFQMLVTSDPSPEWQEYSEKLRTLPYYKDAQKRRELHEDFIRNHPQDPHLVGVYLAQLYLLVFVDPEEAIKLADRFLGDADTYRVPRVNAYQAKLESISNVEDVEAARKLAPYILEHEDDYHAIAMARSYDVENRFSYLETAKEGGLSNWDLRWVHRTLTRVLARAGKYEEAAQHTLDVADEVREDRHQASNTNFLAHCHLMAAKYFAETSEPERGLLHVREAEQLGNAELGYPELKYRELRHPEDPNRTEGPEMIRGQILERLGREEEALSSYIRSYARRADPHVLARIESLSAQTRKPLSDSLGRVEQIRQNRLIFKPFQLGTLQGETRQLSDFKARVLLISFFSPSCEPCLSEAPYLAELHRKYRNQGLEILAINTTPEQAEELYEWRDRYTFPILVGASPESLLKSYNYRAGSSTSASYILLDEERRVMFRHHRQPSAKEGVLEAEVRQLLTPKSDAPPPRSKLSSRPVSR